MNYKTQEYIGSRRSFIASLIAISFPILTAAKKLNLTNLFFGTYNSETNKSIIPFGIDFATSRFQKLKTKSAIENASFAVYNKRNNLHYIANENESGTIGVYQKLNGDLKNYLK